ncbi:MAG: TetR/AcrR family transcriptional regulator [Lachnospiraceae bacterium]|nr:TetR/AcrR family transcriptional regulator [Lachnospiraceae bacterium]
MENQRIRLTKRMLKEALIRLLEQKPIEKVTVHELCAEAEINRTTFYKYYGSQFDLMDDMQEDFVNELETSMREKEPPISLLNILTYINNHRAFCTTLLKSADNGLLKKIFSVSLVKQQLEAQTASRYDGYKSEYVKEFVIYGCYSIVRRWLTTENPETPEEITNIMIELIERI